VNEWISAGIAVGAAVIVGAIAARVVRNLLARSDKEAVRSAAAPLATLVLSACFIVGLAVALGFVHPESLDTIPDDLVDFVPRAIAAAIVLIGGNVVASVARTATQRAIRGTSAERIAPLVVRWSILAFSFILAAAQLGVDTTIVNIAAAALLFGTALAMALLVGLGGRDVAGQVAAGRASRATLSAGDRIRVADVAGVEIDGVVVDVHPTAVEIDAGGRTVLVPNSHLLDVVIERTRPD
jgi:small-conductance mechanosensitive channel